MGTQRLICRVSGTAHHSLLPQTGQNLLPSTHGTNQDLRTFARRRQTNYPPQQGTKLPFSRFVCSTAPWLGEQKERRHKRANNGARCIILPVLRSTRDSLGSFIFLKMAGVQNCFLYPYIHDSDTKKQKVPQKMALYRQCVPGTNVPVDSHFPHIDIHVG